MSASRDDAPPSAPDLLRVLVDVAPGLERRVRWACDELLMRAGVTAWRVETHAAGSGSDSGSATGLASGSGPGSGSGPAAGSGSGRGSDAVLHLPHDPEQWRVRADAPPDAALDPLAATFWWLARVEEQLAPEEAFDEHGRFRYASSYAARTGTPLATPVDDIARELAEQVPVELRRAHDPTQASWRIVPTHDIDVPWRWTRRGRRRAVKRVLAELRAGRASAAAAIVAALAAAPVWRLRRDDPWCNAHRIRRLEWRYGATSTSYLLVAHHAPHDGDPDVLELGRDRYAQRLIERPSSSRRRTRRYAVAGLHGSYTSSIAEGRLEAERTTAERLVGGEVRDHRFHYLRHRPVDAWPQLAAAGLRTDASLGWAEQPGFRAGTAHPFRAWHHDEDRPLDLVVIPLAFMDASLDERYLATGPGPAGTAVAFEVLDAVRRAGGTASILFHNDRLCTVDARAWTRLYAAMLDRVAQGGGACVTAHTAGLRGRSS